MKTQPISTNFQGYHDLSDKILKCNRKQLMHYAEYFYTASEREIQQVTRSSKEANAKLKDAIKAVVTRVNCYLADGSNYCKQKAAELKQKASTRIIFLRDK